MEPFDIPEDHPLHELIATIMHIPKKQLGMALIYACGRLVEMYIDGSPAHPLPKTAMGETADVFATLIAITLQEALNTVAVIHNENLKQKQDGEQTPTAEQERDAEATAKALIERARKPLH